MTTEAPNWEQSKENAAPLQRGRNVAILEQSLSVETEEEHRTKKKMMEHYERLVRPSEMSPNDDSSTTEDVHDDDPLIHWLSYIKFHQEAFPSDTQAQFLLIERCTRALVRRRKYADDVRFIRVCATYADKTSNAGEIFKYLHSLRVGGHTALFWVAWAWWAEKQGDFQFAEKAFKKGISKKAHPLELLKQRHKQFQRRMSRHWLNSSSTNSSDDALDENGNAIHYAGSRGVLGSLSRDALARNPRHRVAQSNNLFSTSGRAPSSSLATFTDRSARNRHQESSLSNNGGSANGGFTIFQETQEANDPHSLDRSVPVNSRRQLPTEYDRKKENTLLAEPWNERGGLQANSSSTYQYLPGSSSLGRRQDSIAPSNPAPFSVFVDEECAAEHAQEEELQRRDREQRRRERDERHFRPLEETTASVADKLFTEPLRYMKDANALNADLEQAKRSHHEDENDEMQQKRSEGAKCGFNKKLLSKDAAGQEQCFEEARKNSSFFSLALPSTNFNYLAQATAQKSSRDDSVMDLDDSSSAGDISMSETESNEKVHIFDENADAEFGKSPHRELFRSNASFDARNTSAVSACSSTVNDENAVGVFGNKEEETINTKLAMRELSMMFSSPAAGLNEPRPLEHVEEDGNDTATFSVVDDLMQSSNSNVNNSILNQPSLEHSHHRDENLNVRPNPQARTNLSPGFEEMVLQPLQGESPVQHLGCLRGPNRSRGVGEISQHDPFRSAGETPFHSDAGFTVYEDPGDESDVRTSEQQNAPMSRDVGERKQRGETVKKGLFAIYDENSADDTNDEPSIINSEKVSEPSSSNKMTFSIFEDESPIREPKGGFSVFRDQPKKAALQKVAPKDFAKEYDGNDTATFSILGDVMDALKEVQDDGNGDGVAPRRGDVT